MTQPIIEVKNLSKEYIISHNVQPYYTLRDSLMQLAKKPFEIFSKKSTSNTKEKFLALNDINFSVMPGEVIGIIGRNGAGKSTLLKILSQITPPSKGSIHLRGRVASLLEVGTGFHPELTGRENIFLNGAILGMTQKEIKSKFDEIVEFSGVEKFLDTPVKRYSSGMYVRLAFAVAAHLEPEILIVDEVLAVGDAEFQKKCLGKMGEVAKGGRTVLFVSHNMNAIEQLCDSCILIEKGCIKEYSKDVRSIISRYLFGDNSNETGNVWVNDRKDLENEWFKPLKCSLTDFKGNILSMPISNNSEFYFCIEGEIKKTNPAFQIGYALYNEEGSLLYWTCHTDVSENEQVTLEEGKNVLISKIPSRFLNEGVYRIELIAAIYYREWICQPGVNSPAITLIIAGGLSDSSFWLEKRPGIFAPLLEWNKFQ